jgi:VWFA-related protein
LYILAPVVLFAAAAAIAQSSAPTTATIQEKNTAPAQQKYMFQSQVPLVVLDVVVTDSGGHPVHGLKLADFNVLESGQKVQPDRFEEHRSDQVPPPEPVLKKETLGPNVFTNYTYTPNNGPLNVLLIDTLNTPIRDQAYVRNQTLAYLKTLPAGTRVAVFGLSMRLYLLQGFTTNSELLQAVLGGKKGLPKSSSLLTTPEEADAQQNQIDAVADSLGNSPGSAEMAANMQGFSAMSATIQTTMRMQYTIAAMNDLARYLSGLPGRKNLIWFSGSFPINIMPDGDLPDPFAAMANYEDDVRATADMMARAQVAIYPIDGRGLFNNPAMSASVSGQSFSRNPSSFTKSNEQFFEKTSAEHTTMDVMAEQTGGKAFYNTNGLKEAVQQAINQGSNYYTLTYTPTNKKWDGSYRNVRIKMEQNGLHLYYRHGYYADDPGAVVHGQKVLPFGIMQTAMLRGGPDPTQILFDVKITPSPSLDNAVPTGNEPEPKLMKPPYRRYTIMYAADVRNVSFTTGFDGVHHGSLEFMAILYDADGTTVNMTGDTMTVNLTEAQFQDFLKRGVRMQEVIDAPAKGEFYLRIGVHDLTSDRVGGVEVPLTSVRPETPSQPAAAATK